MLCETMLIHLLFIIYYYEDVLVTNYFDNQIVFEHSEKISRENGPQFGPKCSSGRWGCNKLSIIIVIFISTDSQSDS